MDKLAILNKTVVPINLRPEFDSEMADEGIYGMVVKIEKEMEYGWYLVETSYDYSGYIMPNPSYKGYVVNILPRGALIILTGQEKDRWLEVQLADESRGWIRKSYIGDRIESYQLDDEENLRQALVDTAMKYMGVQYRWGGKTPLGLDCSGLCSIAYLINGIKIYRDADLRGPVIKSIPIDQIKKGDLIFFPGHVAMYLGDNKYIHSSQSIDGVGINSLDLEDKDYLAHYGEKITGIGSIFSQTIS